MPSAAACTYHPFQNTYACDPRQSTAILKAGMQQAFETANTNIGDYFNRRLLPLYEAHPLITGWVSLVVVILVMKRYRWALLNMLVLGVLMLTFHAWTGEGI